MKNKEFILLLPIETERLIIKPTGTCDVDLILKMDKQVKTQCFLGGLKNKTKEERIYFLEKKARSFDEGFAGSLTVFIKEKNNPIGFIGLKISEENNNGELSYIFDEDFTKNGYCTEASRKLIDIGFSKLNLNKIYANTFNGNEDSIKLLKKLGFRHEGTRREAIYSDNLKTYLNILDFGIVKKEYKK